MPRLALWDQKEEDEEAFVLIASPSVHVAACCVPNLSLKFFTPETLRWEVPGVGPENKASPPTRVQRRSEPWTKMVGFPFLAQP